MTPTHPTHPARPFPSRNLLSDALSPYLLQHADNPVHWRQWNADALDEARQRDVPVLLSVGYAACHWCHVMAHECFADPRIAAMMNAMFVNVKVDREERPDLDRVYQAAHHLLARRTGGWPLTMFLAPDGAPFFGGTYFPPTPRGGMPAFPEVLSRVSDAWKNRRDAVENQNEHVREILARLDEIPTVSGEPDDRPLHSAREKFRAAFDRRNGGIGRAPKFPRPAELAFCLREGVRASDDDIVSEVRRSLEKMANGGIFDHLAGGFCRYAVDETWTIPHFEKMLYDNALLLPLCAEFGFYESSFNDSSRRSSVGTDESDAPASGDSPVPAQAGIHSDSGGAMGSRFRGKGIGVAAGAAESCVPPLERRDEYLINGDEDSLLRAATMTGDWVLREMRDAESGGFWSSLDADSEGREGKFYVWRDADIRGALCENEYRVASARFGLAAGPNFEGEHHLARRQSFSATAAAVGIPPDACAALWESARGKLLAVRDGRVRPGTDDKILAGWNGLMIRGLARAGRLLEKPEWTAAAGAALDFIRREMRDGDGGLLGVWRRGRRGRAGFLDDYAFVLEGALEVLACDFSADTLRFATELGEGILGKFSDPDGGGFFLIPADGEELIRRPKPLEDDAVPSANGAAVRGLLRLSWLVGEGQFAEAGEDAIRAFAGAVLERPEGCPTLLLAMREWLNPPPVVLLTGDATECRAWQRTLEKEFPGGMFFVLPGTDAGLPEGLRKPRPEAGKDGEGGEDGEGGKLSVLGYVCSGFSCRPAAGSLEEVRGFLGE